MNNMTSKQIKLLNSLFWVVLACFIFGQRSLRAANNGPKWTPEDIRRESEKIFGKLRVVPLKISIEEQYLGKLQKSYTNLPVYVPAEIQQGSNVYSQVGLRLRGVSTFQPVDEKPNFTLKFNEFVDGQKFFGLRKIHLSNAMFDKTYVQELLAYQLFTAAGVVAQRVNFARVELNGRDLGLYVMIEGVTKDFLKLNWGTDEGSVYEADEADVDGYLEQDYGKRDRHQTDLRALVAALNEPNADQQLAKLKAAIDVKLFASYVAVEILMNLWDGYSMRINNYRVFSNHQDGKVYFIPHGCDRLFDDPTDPIMPEWEGRVAKVLLELPETRKLYLKRLAELTSKLMAKDALFKRMDDASEVIQPTLKELERDRHQWRALFIFKKRIERRIEVLNTELPPLLQEAGLATAGKSNAR